MLNLHRLWAGCRVISHLFDRMESEREGGGTYLVRCSYLEIYNEEVRDLLQPATASKQIHIRERENGDIFVSGVSEKHAPTQQVLTQLLERGSAARATGATLMNQASSRSHAIFTLTLEQHRPQVNGWTRSTRF